MRLLVCFGSQWENFNIFGLIYLFHPKKLELVRVRFLRRRVCRGLQDLFGVEFEVSGRLRGFSVLSKGSAVRGTCFGYWLVLK